MLSSVGIPAKHRSGLNLGWTGKELRTSAEEQESVFLIICSMPSRAMAFLI